MTLANTDAMANQWALLREVFGSGASRQDVMENGGWVAIRNTDLTNSITYGPVHDGDMIPVTRLDAGIHAVSRIDAGVEVFVQADAGGVACEVMWTTDLNWPARYLAQARAREV